jgi:cytochrome c551/c552
LPVLAARSSIGDADVDLLWLPLCLIGLVICSFPDF